MSSSINESFVRQYEAEVHVAYQRMGSKLRPTVRSKNNVQGKTAVFQKVGFATAVRKSQGGIIPSMNVDHQAVYCTLNDYYAGDWIDFLDELKINHDEKLVTVNAGAYALGRQTDDLILMAMESNPSVRTTTREGGLTREKVLEAFEILGESDVPDDGQRTAIVGWKQWTELFSIPEFADADYIGTDELPWKGTQAKRWLGTLWLPHSGLRSQNGNVHCHWYHKSAIAHASGQDIRTDITWHGERASYFVNSMMSQGAVLIDPAGMVRIPCQIS